MPRLHGYRERIWKNWYDALFYGADVPLEPSMKLFGLRNIGRDHLSNLDTADMFPSASSATTTVRATPAASTARPSDHTMVILNWYARTNLLAQEDAAALAAVASTMTATLVVGSKPCYEMSVADLLRGAPGDEKSSLDGKPANEVLTAWAQHREKKIADISKETEVSEAAVAKVLDAVNYPSRAVVIPVRQAYAVVVSVHNPRAIDELRQRFDRPTLHPGLWIHLEGWYTRDVQ